MKKNREKTVWIIILVICVLVCVLCAGFLIKYFFVDPSNTLQKPDVTQPATSLSLATDTIAVETQPQTQRFSETTAPLTDHSVDFTQLKKINPDIYAWIYIPNTDVDYPIVQSSAGVDDSFYLTHNIYKEYQFSGSIYTEKKNNRDFYDPVTVVYGHNMLNGTMFASLHKFNDKEFFEKNNTMYVFTKDKVLTYLIYSAYQYDDRHLLNSADMTDQTDFKQYLDSTLVERPYYCNVRKNIELNTNDHILTLSTCMDGGGNVRYLVQGVLVNEQSTK